MPSSTWEKCNGITLDGQNPCCPVCDPPGGLYNHDYPCPTIQIQPPKPKTKCCPPPEPDWGCFNNPNTPKNYLNVHTDCDYCPGRCNRPCCKHFKSKEPCCKYDDPCKAHCFNHPPGMQPSGRYPPNVYKEPLRR